MSGFLYFAPGLRTLDPAADVDRLKLRYAFERSPSWSDDGGKSPSGAAGVIFADSTRGLSSNDGEPSISYFPDEQVWRKRPACDGPEVWIGYYKSRPPLPSELIRSKTLPGERVLLSDGHAWLAPRLLFWAGDGGYQVELPTKIDFNDAGELVKGEVLAPYAALTTLVDRLYAMMVGGKPLSTAEAVETAGTILGINYVVGERELMLLGALAQDASLLAIGEVAADSQRANRWAEAQVEKKKVALARAASTG